MEITNRLINSNSVISNNKVLKRNWRTKFSILKFSPDETTTGTQVYRHLVNRSLLISSKYYVKWSAIPLATLCRRQRHYYVQCTTQPTLRLTGFTSKQIHKFTKHYIQNETQKSNKSIVVSVKSHVWKGKILSRNENASFDFLSWKIHYTIIYSYKKKLKLKKTYTYTHTFLNQSSRLMDDKLAYSSFSL